MPVKHICHLTSVHPANDIRVFKKQCVSLAKAGFKVSYVVLNGPTEKVDGVEIIGVPCAFKGRMQRASKGTKAILKKAIEIDADVYQIHDPEMTKPALRLRSITGKPVVADVHEYTAGQIKQKHYIPDFAKPLVSSAYAAYEKRLLKQFDGVFLAVPFAGTHLEQINPNREILYNYPILDEFVPTDDYRTKNLIYVGGLADNRGLSQMIKLAKGHPEWVLKLAGNFHDESQKAEVESWKTNSNIHYAGFLSRTEVRDFYANGGIGLLLFKNKPNLRISLPIKLFEYMAAGLPVVVNDFPHWKEIVEKNKCGICVNPTDTATVEKAISTLFENPDLAQEMGKNGRKIVEQHFSWEKEEQKLVAFYKNLLA